MLVSSLCGNYMYISCVLRGTMCGGCGLCSVRDDVWGVWPVLCEGRCVGGVACAL